MLSRSFLGQKPGFRSKFINSALHETEAEQTLAVLISKTTAPGPFLSAFSEGGKRECWALHFVIGEGRVMQGDKRKT